MNTAAKPAAGTGPLVLLVEDNEVNRYLAQFVLERAGFRVAQAADGGRALQLARELAPDLILMDLRMPVLDGYETTRRLKADPDPRIAATPVVALSAHAMPQERERALAAGCLAHIEKPIDPTVFAEQVRALLRPGGAGAHQASSAPS